MPSNKKKIRIGESVKQWEKYMNVILDDVSEIEEVYFTSGATDKIYPVPFEYDYWDNTYIVQIPNTLLMSDWDIKGWYYHNNGEKRDFVIPVISRNKPDDYKEAKDNYIEDKPTIEKKVKRLRDELNGQYELMGKNNFMYAGFPNLDMTEGFEYGTYQLIQTLPYSFYYNYYNFSGITDRDYKNYKDTSYTLAIRLHQFRTGNTRVFDRKDFIISQAYDFSDGFEGMKQLGNSENWEVYYNDTEIIFVVDANTLPEPYKSNIDKTGVYLHTTKSGVNGEVITDLHIRTVELKPFNQLILPKNVVLGMDIDKTLTQDTKPADAKTVGDRLKAIEDRLAALEK